MSCISRKLPVSVLVLAFAFASGDAYGCERLFIDGV